MFSQLIIQVLNVVMCAYFIAREYSLLFCEINTNDLIKLDSGFFHGFLFCFDRIPRNILNKMILSSIFRCLSNESVFFLKFLSVWKISNFMFVFEKTANICSKSTWIIISNSSNALFCFALRCVFRRTFLKCKSFYDRRVAPSCLCCVSFH